MAQGTRADIAFAVNDVSRFSSNFGKAHCLAVKHISRYLKRTLKYKVRYLKSNYNKLFGYSDADWALDVDKRRSCTGYIFLMCGGAIFSANKRQQTVALSTEAEYVALSATVQEAL